MLATDSQRAANQTPVRLGRVAARVGQGAATLGLQPPALDGILRPRGSVEPAHQRVIVVRAGVDHALFAEAVRLVLAKVIGAIPLDRAVQLCRDGMIVDEKTELGLRRLMELLT